MKIKLVARKDHPHRVDIFNNQNDVIAVIHVDDLFDEPCETFKKLKTGEEVILTDGIDNVIYKDKP